MSANESISGGHSQLRRGRKNGGGNDEYGASTAAPRCHIDVTMTPELRARIEKAARRLGCDKSKFMRKAAEGMLRPEGFEKGLTHLVREREDRELERALHGIFLLINHVVAAGEGAPEEAAAPQRITRLLELVARREGRDLLRQLARQVADLIEARRGGGSAPQHTDEGDMSLDGERPGGKS